MHSRKLEFSLSAFHCAKNTGLNFWKFPVPNETAFRGSLFLQVSFQNSENEDNLAKKIQSFQNLFPDISVSFNFAPSQLFPEFFFLFFFLGGGGGGGGGGGIFQKFNSFKIFGQNVPPLFLDFQNFVVKWKVPLISSYAKSQ